mmetsp:Transcript_15152/g.60879  ORF Transcript_15152/g.60879 Transcript_15152/m.60879 type:complete len:201 (+) Transcript_15152:186-788(+)
MMWRWTASGSANKAGRTWQSHAPLSSSSSSSSTRDLSSEGGSGRKTTMKTHILRDPVNSSRPRARRASCTSGSSRLPLRGRSAQKPYTGCIFTSIIGHRLDALREKPQGVDDMEAGAREDDRTLGKVVVVLVSASLSRCTTGRSTDNRRREAHLGAAQHGHDAAADVDADRAARGIFLGARVEERRPLDFVALTDDDVER